MLRDYSSEEDLQQLDERTQLDIEMALEEEVREGAKFVLFFEVGFFFEFFVRFCVKYRVQNSFDDV